MGTNYYEYHGKNMEGKDSEGEHVGKTSYRPRGTTSTLFIWAKEPVLVHNFCLANPTAQMFIDEYGKILTAQELKVIFDGAAWDVGSIGQEFC